MDAIFNKSVENDIIDLEISCIERKKIRINGDNNKILLLNVNDNNVIVRYSETLPKLESLKEDFKQLSNTKIDDNFNAEDFTEFANRAKEIDDKMKSYMDYIFNAKVADMCSDGGSMYDFLDNGLMRWETILAALIKFYGETITKNVEQAKKLKELTSKYS